MGTDARTRSKRCFKVPSGSFICSNAEFGGRIFCFSSHLVSTDWCSVPLGPCSHIQPSSGRPWGGADEGSIHFGQLRLPSSEPRADGHAVPEESHRPGYGPGSQSHHRPGLRCTELHGKHRRVRTVHGAFTGSLFLWEIHLERFIEILLILNVTLIVYKVCVYTLYLYTVNNLAYLTVPLK